MKITLQSHKDYMKRMFRSMTVRDAERHSGFIEALYATEAYLVEQARKQSLTAEAKKSACKKDESPAFARLSPSYVFSIAKALKLVNA